MRTADRRVRRTRKSLHEALIALLLERSYDTVTVQDILDRADVGRSTFYAHFQDKDELLMSGIEDLRLTLAAAMQKEQAAAKRHNHLLAFGGAMFAHVNEYRNVYYALVRTRVFPLVRQQLLGLLNGLIERECRSELAKLKRTAPEMPAQLLISHLSATFFTVLTWWLDRRERLSPSELDHLFRALAAPTVQALLG